MDLLNLLLTWGPPACAACATWATWPRIKVVSYVLVFPQLWSLPQAARREAVRDIDRAVTPSWRVWAAWIICVYIPAKVLDIVLVSAAPWSYPIGLSAVIFLGPLICGPGTRLAMAVDQQTREGVLRVLEGLEQVDR